MTAARCSATTRAGKPCTMPVYAQVDGAPLCAGHASRAGHEGARAELAARLQGAGKARPRPRPRKAAGDPIAARVAELQRLADAAERRRDLDLVARYHGMINELLGPGLRVAAEAAAAAASAQPAAQPSGPIKVHVGAIVARLTDEELAALKRCCAVAREVALEQLAPPAAPTAAPAEQPADMLTVNPKETEQ